MPKWVRDLAISAQPLVVTVGAALIKATTDQEFTSATWWLLASGVVSGGLAMYMHFITSVKPEGGA